VDYGFRKSVFISSATVGEALKAIDGDGFIGRYVFLKAML